MVRGLFRKAALAATLCVAAGQQAIADIVPDFGSWTLSGRIVVETLGAGFDPLDPAATVGAVGPCVGTRCTNLGDLSNAAYLFDALSGLTPNGLYNFSFSFFTGAGAPAGNTDPNEILVVAGATISGNAATGGTVLFDGVNISPASWQSETVTFQANAAGDSSLLIAIRNDPNTTYAVNDSSGPVAATPEPGESIPLAALSLGLAVALFRGRRALGPRPPRIGVSS